MQVLQVAGGAFRQGLLGREVLHCDPAVIAERCRCLEVLKDAGLSVLQSGPLAGSYGNAGRVPFPPDAPDGVFHVTVGKVFRQQLEGRQVILLAFNHQGYVRAASPPRPATGHLGTLARTLFVGATGNTKSNIGRWCRRDAGASHNQTGEKLTFYS